MNTKSCWILKTVTFLCVLLCGNIFFVQPAIAELRKPLQGAALKNGLTPEQHARAMYFLAVKTGILQTGSADANSAIKSIELANQTIHAALTVLDMLDARADIYEKSTRISQASNIIANGISGPRLKNYLIQRSNEDRTARILTVVGLVLDTITLELPVLLEDSLYSQYIEALKSDNVDNIIVKFNNLLDHPDPAINMVVNSVVEIVTAIMPMLPELYNTGKAVYELKWWLGLFDSIKLVNRAYKVTTPVTSIITSAIGISTDLIGAHIAADISSELKTTAFALEFLDYYLVTYGGDLNAFQTDMFANGSTSIAQLFDIYGSQQASLSQTMEQFYGAVDWQDYIIGFRNMADKTAAVAMIRKIMRETGALAFRFSFEGTSGLPYIGAGDTTAQLTLIPDPLLMMDYDFEAAMVVEHRLNGNTANHAIPSSGGAITLADTGMGSHKFDISYGFQEKGTLVRTAYTFTYTGEVLVPANSLSFKPLNITPTVSSNSNGYSLSMTLDLPADAVTYSRPATSTNAAVTGTLPLGSTPNLRVRFVDLNGSTANVSNWVSFSSGNPTVTMPIFGSDALAVKSGTLAQYRVEIELAHPNVYGVGTSSYNKIIDYSDLVSNTITPYLEVQVSSSVRAASLSARALKLSPNDTVRLYPRNTPGWPDFKVLTGVVSVWLNDANDKTYQILGTLLDDGGVEFRTSGAMPTTITYQVKGIASTGEVAPEFTVQQLMELPPLGGTPVCWGYGQGVLVPPGLDDVIYISSKEYHTLALRSNGAVVSWGISVPDGVTQIKSISAGAYHDLALRTNGTVLAWGANSSGQTNVPSNLSNVIAVAAGYMHSIALKSDGTVVAWGNNSSGQTNVPTGLNNVKAISAGLYQNLALKSDGTVVAWGYGGSVPVGLNTVKAVSANGQPAAMVEYAHNLALKEDGTVVGWGDNDNGQINIPVGLTNVTSIVAGSSHSVALKNDGTVVAWGANWNGQTNVPSGLTSAIQIAAGTSHTCALLGTPTGSSYPPSPSTTFLSENLPDGSYQVGPNTKSWRFKSGASSIVGLKAVQVSADSGLGITQTEIAIGEISANSEFLVQLPINPVHDATNIKSAYWKFIDGSGQSVAISNSKTGNFWLKVITNKAPTFSLLQLVSVAGKVNQQVCMPLQVEDADGDSLSYNVTAGSGSVINGTCMGKTGPTYINTFGTPGIIPVTVQASDGHGGTANTAFQAVITSDSSIKDFYNDVTYANAITQAQKDQYNAIHYLTLNGITIGSPVDPNDPSNLARNFNPYINASQAEALAMVMKSATVRGVLELDTELRWLPNLVISDVANGIFQNYSWAIPYVLKAETLGMISSADSFNPAAPVKREWLATLVARMMSLNTPMDVINPADYVFEDQSSFSTTAAYDAARTTGFFGYMGSGLGSNYNFYPQDNMIRADVAMVAAKILRSPTIEGISTSMIVGTLYDKQLPTVEHRLSIAVNGANNLIARRMLGDGAGNIKVDDIFSPDTYTKAYIIRPGYGYSIAPTIAGLATTAVTVPTSLPDITKSEVRNLVVLLESTDFENGNSVRGIYRMDYGVVFPDIDNDGVRDDMDKWKTNPLYAFDNNGNGIPDNADSLWGLTSRNGNDTVSINGNSMKLIDSILNNELASDVTAPTTTPSLPGGNYDSPQSVTLSANETATIRCTTDGVTVPTSSSQICNSLIISGTTAVMYYATDLAGNKETVKQVNYVISQQGSCGSDNGNILESTSPTLPCNFGTPSIIAGDGHPWTWTCQGDVGTDPASCTASIKTFNLSVVVPTSNGKGDVLVNVASNDESPKIIFCPKGFCSAFYDFGKTVRLTASPDPISLFSTWEGGCVTTNPCDIEMTGAKSIIANFNRDYYFNNHTQGVTSDFLSGLMSSVNSKDEIRMLATEIVINSILLNKALTLTGGWKALHQSQATDPTILNGALTIQNESLTLKNTTVKGKLSVTSGKLTVDGVIVRSAL